MKRIAPLLMLFPLLWLAQPRVATAAFIPPKWDPRAPAPMPDDMDFRLKFALPPEQLPRMFRGKIIVRRPVALKEKVIALTFDDGPDPSVTPEVLDALKRFQAHATFFIMGVRGKTWPALVMRAAKEGHAIESHSYSHPNQEISEWHAWRELQRTGIVIGQWGGRAPTLFRPPYGNLNDRLTREALRQGMCVVRWTASGEDHPRLTAAEVLEAVTKHPVSGDIVLLHDGRDRHSTARALPEILRRLANQGFKFVTVPDLLRRWDAALQKRKPAPKKAHQAPRPIAAHTSPHRRRS